MNFFLAKINAVPQEIYDQVPPCIADTVVKKHKQEIRTGSRQHWPSGTRKPSSPAMREHLQAMFFLTALTVKLQSVAATSDHNIHHHSTVIYVRPM